MQWSSSESYADRMAGLIDYLARVADDGAGDVLAGSSGTDWFFATPVRRARGM